MEKIQKRNRLKKKMIDYSINNNLKHIPSALSMFNYLWYLFNNIDKEPLINVNTFNICIGKPFGSQCYYILWKKYNNLDISNLSIIVNHNEIPFVDFSEETIGNTLGVASGIQLANNKKTWVNISDACLQIGSTLEAIQFIGSHKQDIFLTIDFNNYQITDESSNILTSHSLLTYSNIFKLYNWEIYIIDLNKENPQEIEQKLSCIIKDSNQPRVVFFKTIKGEGILEMEQNSTYWHYNQLNNINDITLRIQ